MATYLDEDILNLYAMDGDEVADDDDAIDEADLPDDEDEEAE